MYKSLVTALGKANILCTNDRLPMSDTLFTMGPNQTDPAMQAVALLYKARLDEDLQSSCGQTVLLLPNTTSRKNLAWYTDRAIRSFILLAWETINLFYIKKLGKLFNTALWS